MDLKHNEIDFLKKKPEKIQKSTQPNEIDFFKRKKLNNKRKNTGGWIRTSISSQGSMKLISCAKHTLLIL
jgi:hypothetical protein